MGDNKRNPIIGTDALERTLGQVGAGIMRAAHFAPRPIDAQALAKIPYTAAAFVI